MLTEGHRTQQKVPDHLGIAGATSQARDVIYFVSAKPAPSLPLSVCSFKM